MINSLVNRPNHVRERQVLVQSSNKPVYLRLPRSSLYFNAYLALFGVGMIGTTSGLYSLIKAGSSFLLHDEYTNSATPIGQVRLKE
ncbi:unnamed protein product [Rhizoctonia solani]|uniref:Uncharacterized protein n=1 Tax=Rhizoctonia solani TaxID=456999 RepID=A0A8H2ZV16_9AGAM|nr:unnamed protein product [Rhizoctonia solani]